MPYLVSTSFKEFFENINLSGDHRTTANSRRDDIVSTLKTRFNVLDSFSSGSIPRFTAIRGYADLDMIVVLHYGEHIHGKKPSQVLLNVRDHLSKYRTDLRRNGQAVTLYYKTWPNVDIVPVSRTTSDDGSVLYYNIPNMNSEEWIISHPRRHGSDIDDRAASYGKELRHLIKMFKWWNKQHSDLMESYHIEVIALEALTGVFSEYTWAMFRLFERAHTLSQSALWHNNGYADQYLIGDYNKRQEIVKRLATATDKAREAWYATYGGRDDHAKAVGIWKQIFGSEFPAYG